MIVHATTLCLNGTGVLIRGKSGAGKSSLALSVLETVGHGLTGEVITTQLVADDQTELVLRGNVILASPPRALAGLLEVRGQGLISLSFVRDVPLCLVVDVKPAVGIERLPLPETMNTQLLGLKLPCVAIDAAHASAAARLRLAWAQLKKT